MAILPRPGLPEALSLAEGKLPGVSESHMKRGPEGPLKIQRPQKMVKVRGTG